MVSNEKLVLESLRRRTMNFFEKYFGSNSNNSRHEMSLFYAKLFILRTMHVSRFPPWKAQASKERLYSYLPLFIGVDNVFLQIWGWSKLQTMAVSETLFPKGLNQLLRRFHKMWLLKEWRSSVHNKMDTKEVHLEMGDFENLLQLTVIIIVRPEIIFYEKRMDFFSASRTSSY